MQIHELQGVGKTKRKRVGRGGKRGTTAGRGTKGQKSRSGGNVDPLFQGGQSSLVQQMKKNRGFKSPHIGQKALSLSTINKNFSDDDTVSLASLKEKKMIRNKDAKGGVRLVSGDLTKKITVEYEVALSKGAKEILEKAGGKVADEIKKPDLKARKVPIAR